MKKQINLPAAGRKLSLNKKTISNLNAAEMNMQVGGGTKGHNNTCYTCGFNKTCYSCGRTNLCITNCTI